MENIVPTLPEDLIFALILPRFPAKTVERFKCVSHDWHDTLSSLRFAKSHMKYMIKRKSESTILRTLPPTNSCCLLNLEKEAKRMVPTWFNHPFGDDKIYICGALNGLVLGSRYGDGDGDHDDKLDLFNPLTRDTLSIPSIPKSKYRLAYDEVREYYKIFAISTVDWRNLYMSIYSLNVGCWRSLGESPYQWVYSCGRGRSGCFINGAMHYLAGRTRDGDDFEIVSFVMDLEEFLVVPYPKDLEAFKTYKWGCVPDLTVIRECLAFLIPSQPLNAYEVHTYDVWVMTEYGVQDSWVKYRIATRLCSFMYDFLGVLEDEILIFKTSKRGLLKFASFNLENLIQEILLEYDGDGYGMAGINGVQSSGFRAGLISPNALASNV